MADAVLQTTARVVAAFVGSNWVASEALPNLIQTVHRTFGAVGASEPAVEAVSQKPAVPVRKSVTDDHIVCLEEGRPFKSLRRHLRTDHGMTPEEYRIKWGLP